MADDFRAYRSESHKSIEMLTSKMHMLEQAKVSIVDFAKHTEADDIRLKRLEKGQWIAVGAILVMQFIAPFIINKIFP